MVWPGFQERRVSCDVEGVIVGIGIVVEDVRVFGQDAIEVLLCKLSRFEDDVLGVGCSGKEGW